MDECTEKRMGDTTVGGRKTARVRIDKH